MVPSNISSRTHVPIHTPAARAWRKASRWILKATCTVRIFSATSENSLRSDEEKIRGGPPSLPSPASGGGDGGRARMSGGYESKSYVFLDRRQPSPRRIHARI